MIDLRPAGYLVGWLVAALGGSMILPLLANLVVGHGQNAGEFSAAAIITVVTGATVSLACANCDRRRIGVQESFLLATVIWAVFPFFGALPFMMGEPHASFTDAFFEAMSALTTTGATVFSGLESLPPGVLLWRGMLQWFGGLGIIVVAMVFLPTLKVGGMQIFRSEAFDTLGKMLPRAGTIAMSLTSIYFLLTFLCFMAYIFTGMVPFDALVHAMTTISTGGMANTDASFSIYGAGTHYVSVIFMVLAALPFVRFMQLAAGSARPILRDTQIQGFLIVIGCFTLVLSVYYAMRAEGAFEPAFREVLFNVTSVATGTGYASADYGVWGPLAVSLFFIIGLIGGCSGSTACSVKIFRYQLLISAISAEVKRIHSPSRVFTPRYAGRAVSDDIMGSVIAFFMFFYLSLAVVAVLLVLVGLEPITAISGAATAIANIGPGLGPEIGPAGNFAGLPALAKWILAGAMLIGRLELMSVFVLFTAAFWRG
ncbi:TrkH family potassium uptake protein [Rhodobacteraceae bacterium DSL-40]|uniref:TrkH family potassium uptake protein n=1 Tax=Amaricoccus sp. B4 TaxID=3368557 RepID=UPI000DACE44A